MAAILVPLFTSGTQSLIVPADTSESDERGGLGGSVKVENSCFGMSALHNYAYIPELDLFGIPFAGAVRWSGMQTARTPAGYASIWVKTYLTQPPTRLRMQRGGCGPDPQSPAYVYAIGLLPEAYAGQISPINDFRKLANDPKGTSFQRNEKAGLAIVARGTKEIWPAFQSVREAIVGARRLASRWLKSRRK